MDVSQEEFEIMVADAEGILISPAGSVVPGVVPRTDNKPVFVSVSGGSILMVRGAVGIIPVVLDDVRVSVRGSASEREAKLRVFCEDVAREIVSISPVGSADDGVYEIVPIPGNEVSTTVAIVPVGNSEAISPVGSAVGIIPVVFRDDETLVPVARGIIVFEVYPAIISVFDDKVGMIPVVVSETAPIVASAEDVVCDDEIPVVGSTIVSESDVGSASISDDEVREAAIVSEDRVAIVGYAIISEDGVHEAAIVSDDGSTDRGSAIDFKISCS